jgi:hypothetical protein
MNIQSRQPPRLDPMGRIHQLRQREPAVFWRKKITLFGDTLTTRATILCIFVLVVITIVLLIRAMHHGAHANSPSHCGFWARD